jgi:hypothetical protein
MSYIIFIITLSKLIIIKEGIQILYIKDLIV